MRFRRTNNWCGFLVFCWKGCWRCRVIWRQFIMFLSTNVSPPLRRSVAQRYLIKLTGIAPCWRPAMAYRFYSFSSNTHRALEAFATDVEKHKLLRFVENVTQPSIALNSSLISTLHRLPTKERRFTLECIYYYNTNYQDLVYYRLDSEVIIVTRSESDT